MAVQIKFDSVNNPIKPTLVLATRNGNKLGVLPAVGIDISDNLQYPELRFTVSKYDNGKEYQYWDEIKDLRLAWCVEWDVWFELNVEVVESSSTVKNITAKAVGVAELSQINIYDTHINTEEDISRDDYVPTVLFDENNANASMLNRIMEKAPHYTIAHVDTSIKNIQRVFEFDNKSIYDAFQDIAKEVNCIFVINSGTNEDGIIAREISVYDLESTCNTCGHRGTFTGTCPECGSTNINEGFGDDTTIFVSVDNLANSITYSTNVDAVKNCFKVEGGDDLMTATFRNCNPNGNGYIWYLTDELKADMSAALRAKIAAYDALYAQYQTDTITIGNVATYNALVDKYDNYNPDLEQIGTIIGYPGLMQAYYNTVDFGLYLKSGLMPAPNMNGTTADDEAGKIEDGLTTNVGYVSIAVINLTSCSESTATSAVLAMAKTLVLGEYQVKVASSSYNSTTHYWTGTFTITNYSNEDDHATTESITVQITDNQQVYYQQRIEKILKNKTDDSYDIISLFEKAIDPESATDPFRTEIKKYCLDSLNSFHEACQACVDILIEQGVGNNVTWAGAEQNLYTNLYLPYYNKLLALEDEIALRENEIAIIDAKYDENGGVLVDGVRSLIVAKVNEIQEALNFENYVKSENGDDLWKEFASYRREDLYKNENYISDGLDNAELFDRALELYEVASEEIYKSANLQHQISASLKNLLTMKEFAPLVQSFAVGNWLRLQVDKKVYKLRLISYKVNFDNLSPLSVEFSDITETKDGISDIQSVLSKASAMATSYDAVVRQASKGKEGKDRIDDWVGQGMALTMVKIVNDAQNQDFVITDHGVLCREYLPITDTYDDQQLKIINKGIYLTDDNWLTSRAGIGKFIYYDPEDGLNKESYGVIADTLVGNLILTRKVGVYNESGTVKIDDKGFVLISDATGQNTVKDVFKIQKKYLDGNDEVIENVIYFDDAGNAHFVGNITATSLTIEGSSAADYIDDRVALITDDMQEAIDELTDAVDGVTTTYYSSTTPTDADIGDIWYDTTTHKIKRYDGSSWSDITSEALYEALSAANDAQSTADGKIVTFAQPSAPSTATIGDLWIDTDDENKLYRWSGLEWQPFRDGTIATAQSTANDALGISTGETGINFKINQSQVATVQIDKNVGLKLTGASGNYFQVTDSQMGFFKSNGNAQLAFNNGDLAITGTLTALTGSNIAGWTTTSNAIYRGSSSFGASNGLYFGTDGLSLGNAFKVSVSNNVFSEFTLGSQSNGVYPLSYKYDADEGKYILSLNNVEFDDSFISTVSSISASTVNAYNTIYRTTIIDGTTPIFPSGASDGDIGVLYDVTSSSSSNNFSFTAQSISVYGSNQQSSLFGLYDSVGGLNILVNSQYATDGSNINTSSFGNYCRAGRSQGTTGNHMPGLAYRNFTISGAANSGSQVKISFTYSTWVYTGSSGNYEMEAGKSRSTLPIYLYDVTAGRQVGVCNLFAGHSGNTTEKCTESYTISLTNSIASGNTVAVVFYSDTTKTLVHIDLSSITLVNTASNSTSSTTTRAIYIRDNGAWVLMADGTTGGGGSSSYTLPIATAENLGGIRIGTGLAIDPTTGIVSVSSGGSSYTLPAATTSTLGGVKISTTGPIYSDANDRLSLYINDYMFSVDEGYLYIKLKSGGGLACDSDGLYVTGGASNQSYTLPNSGIMQFFLNATTQGYVSGSLVQTANTSMQSQIKVVYGTAMIPATGADCYFRTPGDSAGDIFTSPPFVFCQIYAGTDTTAQNAEDYVVQVRSVTTNKFCASIPGASSYTIYSGIQICWMAIGY